jgi:hypothetical protein
MPEFKTRQEYLKWKEEREKNPSAAPPGVSADSKTPSSEKNDPASGGAPIVRGNASIEVEAAQYAAKVRELTAAIQQEAIERKAVDGASESSVKPIFQCPACQSDDVANAQSYIAPTDGASVDKARQKSPLAKRILKYRPRPAAQVFRFDNKGFTEDKVEIMRFGAAGVFILAGGLAASVILCLILRDIGALLLAMGALFFLVRQYRKFREGRCLDKCNPLICVFDKSQRGTCSVVQNLNIDKMRAAMLESYFQDMKATRENQDAARRWNDLYLCRRCETLFDVRTRDVL